MLRQKIIKRKALEIIVSVLNEYVIPGTVNIEEYSEETNDKISEYIGLRIDKLKEELKKLQ